MSLETLINLWMVTISYKTWNECRPIFPGCQGTLSNNELGSSQNFANHKVDQNNNRENDDDAYMKSKNFLRVH